MKYRDLRDFIAQLEKQGELKRVRAVVDPHLEMTEICDRVLRAQGPAMLFENPRFHTCRYWPICSAPRAGSPWAWARTRSAALREVGKLLAYLKEPEPPKGLKDAWEKRPVFKQVLNMAPKIVSSAALPGNGVGRRRGGLRPAAHPDLLAGRCRTAYHLGLGGHPRPK